jgi:hypothetical protein
MDRFYHLTWMILSMNNYVGTMELVSRKIDGFVKSPSAALRCILSHCGVQVSTPHSVGFARLASEAFYCAV